MLIQKIKHWTARNWFLAGLLLAAFTAWVFPEPGAAGGVLRSEVTTKAGIVVIFFFQGLSLPLSMIRQGLLQWRLHIFVQVFIFMVMPLLVLGLCLPVWHLASWEMKMGFIFLGALPTTIATAITYTAMSGGNVAGAVFNAAGSNLAGIFITPLWISFWMKTGGQNIPLEQVIAGIAMMIMLPMLAGQVIRPFVRRKVDKHKKTLSTMSSLIILFIVYAAFCESWMNNIWAGQGTLSLVLAVSGAILLYVLARLAVYAGIRWMGFNRENARAALFCSTQKTLAAGVPLGNMIFASHPALGTILLPLMFYHGIQLLLDGILVNRIIAGKETSPS